VSTNPPGDTVTAVPRTTRNRRLQILAIPILAFILAEIFIGNSLAGESGPYSTGVLVAHVGIAIFLELVSGFTVGVSFRMPRRGARGVALLTHLSLLGATISGALFLWAGGSNDALYGMEGLAAVAFLGAIFLLFAGAVPVPAAPS